MFVFEEISAFFQVPAGAMKESSEEDDDSNLQHVQEEIKKI